MRIVAVLLLWSFLVWLTVEVDDKATRHKFVHTHSLGGEQVNHACTWLYQSSQTISRGQDKSIFIGGGGGGGGGDSPLAPHFTL